MKIFCKNLDKEFHSKDELFQYLRINHDRIIAAKKAQIYKSCDKGLSLIARPLDQLKIGISEKQFNIDPDFYYIAVNSTRVLDSHEDLHLDGLWKKTIKDQVGKLYLVFSHSLDPEKTIARKEHIEVFTSTVPFSIINKPYEGDTEILIYKIRKDKVINQFAKEWLDSGDEIQASVRMRYIDIVFALDSDAKEDVKFKQNFDELFPLIANKNDFENDIMFFWGVKQAMNVFESSLVLFGSNPSTGQVNEKRGPQISTLENNQPPIGTGKNEPSLKDTQKRNYLLNLLKN